MYDKLIQFTFFVDMLGFGNKVGRIDNQEKADKFIEFMETNKSLFTAYSEKDTLDKSKLVNIPNFYEFNYSFISDSIVISFAPKILKEKLSEELYYMHSASLFFIMTSRIITLLFNACKEHKILFRGGVSTKFSYIKNEFVVGEGLIEAYKLESIEAKYPRILLSKELSNKKKFMESLKLISNKMYGKCKIIKKDIDDCFFIDYLSLLIGQANMTTPYATSIYKGQLKLNNNVFFNYHKEAIEDTKNYLDKLSPEDKNYESIKEKYDWIKKYHNSHLSSTHKI